ncbi:MAG TPA: 5-oxoprolinase subunit PxpB [Burkholderiaceae bacterium]
MGTGGAVMQAPGAAMAEVQARLWSLAALLRADGGFRDIVPGMNNLTVIFDEDAHDGEHVLARLRGLWPQTEAAALERRRVEIPVYYGGDDGADLDDVARHCGMTASEVVAAHAGADYTVYFLGFQPGFAYLGGLPERLATPRRDTPRIQVPAGSVGIGGSQTGIYPQASPGGWQLIGRTPLALFDAGRREPALLAPGDLIRFVPQ